MLISGREAARRLQVTGMTERTARRVLATGLAGEPLRASALHLYEAERVDALAARPFLRPSDVRAACPYGLFVARRSGPIDGRIDDLAGGWPLSLAATFWVRHLADLHGSLPLVATTGGFVTHAADIVGATLEPGSSQSHPSKRLELRPAGAWAAQVRDRRLYSRPGPSWELRDVPGWPGD